MEQAGPRPGVGERVFAAIIGAIFAVQFVMALGYPPEPRLFPLIVAVAGMLFSVALLAGIGLHDLEMGPPEPIARGKLALTLAVSPLYGIALFFVGYWIATLAAVPTVAWLLGYRNARTLAIVTISLAVVLGVLFPLLGVGLPRGLLVEKLGL
jgi:hypothetical protein